MKLHSREFHKICEFCVLDTLKGTLKEHGILRTNLKKAHETKAL